MSKVAIACFVKTPGLSPVKTRLAATVGQEWATRFYEISCNAIRSVLAKAKSQSSHQLDCFWAVAEQPEQAKDRWRDFPLLGQGEGDLGRRLHNIYSRLASEYEKVILIGADAPQLTAPEIDKAIEFGSEADFVIGPSRDGGFYLFLGNKTLPREDWESVPYSSHETASRLETNLRERGSIRFLKSMVDVDTEQDLPILQEELWRVADATQEQNELMRWLRLRASLK